MAQISAALVDKAGELLVAAELLRRGVEVAYPASDVGVDLLAYRLAPGQKVPGLFVPIQVKARAASGYEFQRKWFESAPGLALVQVWFTVATPQFYVFRDIAGVEAALDSHAETASWRQQGGYSVTVASERHIILMQPHRDRWDRVIDQLGALSA